jgi:hypothetical protein
VWNNPLLDELERYAEDCQCHGVEAAARFGFWPFFKGRGYGRSYCLYEKMHDASI